jgi:putative transposase
MARLARIVVPGLPHHITQRGNGRQRVFFSDDDYQLYLTLLKEAADKARVRCLCYCLMPNHLHLILVPRTEDGLRACLSRANRAYAGVIHARRKLTGHFWQGRYGSVVMDGPHFYEALRYVLMNPVKAKLVAAPAQWPWSSARAYVKSIDDGLTDVGPANEMVADWPAFFGEAPDQTSLNRLLAGASVGRPVGAQSFISRLEVKTGRSLMAEKRGPKASKETKKKVRKKGRK